MVSPLVGWVDRQTGRSRRSEGAFAQDLDMETNESKKNIIFARSGERVTFGMAQEDIRQNMACGDTTKPASHEGGPTMGSVGECDRGHC